ncbi:MAG: uroporphyrinogen-III synthase [Chitinophagales bacterium]|nr:uroporphyrinogen-III synthase [Chitinophagales bacterium]MDW8418394.1 uroporphyrinogen-III synthase [Chitinophagales bacterium]
MKHGEDSKTSNSRSALSEKADVTSPAKSASSFKEAASSGDTPISPPVSKPAHSSKSSIIIPQLSDKNYQEYLSKEPKTKVKNILVAQPQPEGPKSPYFELEKKYNVKFTFIPFITVEGVPGKEFRKQRITLTDYGGIIFTSRNAIDHFFRICEELRVKMSQETKYFCTSEAIALYLQKYIQYRKRKVFFGDLHNNKELRMFLMKHRDATRFLYICAEVRKDEIPAFMQANNFNYAEAVMYRTVPNDLSGVKLSAYDMVLFFSPTGVHSLYHNFPKFKQGDMKIGVYGKTTADAIIEKGLKLHLMAPLPGNPTIIAALENYLKAAK